MEYEYKNFRGQVTAENLGTAEERVSIVVEFGGREVLRLSKEEQLKELLRRTESETEWGQKLARFSGGFRASQDPSESDEVYPHRHPVMFYRLRVLDEEGREHEYLAETICRFLGPVIGVQQYDRHLRGERGDVARAAEDARFFESFSGPGAAQDMRVEVVPAGTPLPFTVRIWAEPENLNSDWWSAARAVLPAALRPMTSPSAVDVVHVTPVEARAIQAWAVAVPDYENELDFYEVTLRGERYISWEGHQEFGPEKSPVFSEESLQDLHRLLTDMERSLSVCRQERARDRARERGPERAIERDR
jgi:hypothetical protein